MTMMAFEEIDFLPDYPSQQAALADPNTGYYFQASANGTDWSNADAVITSVTSQLFDGAHVEVASFQPMTATIRVKIVGTDPGRLAAAGAVLTGVCRRPGVRSLSFTPPDAPTTVFDVLVAVQKLEYNSYAEVNGIPYPYRVYVLTLTCKPFPRSDELVSVAAIAPPSGAITNTSIDTGSATTNWAAGSQAVSRVNLMPNPSFETGTTGWRMSSGTVSISRVAAGASGGAGSYYLFVAPSSTATRSYVYSPTVSVTAGLSYAFQCRISTAFGPSATGGMLIRWYDVNGNQVGADATYTTTKTAPSSSFTTVSAVYTAPAGAVIVLMFPFLNEPGTSTGNTGWALDAVMIEQASSVGTYFDGSSGSTFAWTGTAHNSTSVAVTPATVTTSGGKVQTAGWEAPSLTRTASITTTTEPYLMITGTLTFPDAAGARNVSFVFSADGNALTPAYLSYPQGSKTGGTFTVYYKIPTASIGTFTLTNFVTSGPLAAAGNTVLAIDQVSTYSGLPIIGTGRQSQRSVTAYGTMPAEADLTLSNGSNTLGGATIVYTKPSDGSTFTPPLRQYRSAGPTVTTSTATISGATNTLATSQATADTFTIDVNTINPSSYLLAAYLTGTTVTAGTTYTFNWRASIVENGTLEHTIVTGSTTLTATASTYPAGIIELGLMTLPPRTMATTGTQAAVVKLQIWVSAGTWTLDDAWLFDVDNGALSMIVTSDTINQIEIVPATADTPQQQYLGTVIPSAGNTITRDLSTSVLSWAAHHFDPNGAGTVDVFIMNNAATPTLAVSADYYPRWDMYAADIEAA